MRAFVLSRSRVDQAIEALPFLIIIVATTILTFWSLFGATYTELIPAFNDDAFYYFQVAHKISQGQGSTFDGIHATNGYHPLWMSVSIGVFSVACVTSGTHEKVVQERDQLAERVKRLTASSESLDTERVSLIDELEDLQQTQTVLDRDVKRLRKAEAKLSQSLAIREAELADRRKEVGRLRETYSGDDKLHETAAAE